jgi:hypothetical protein
MDRRTWTFECTNTSGPFLVALELLGERENPDFGSCGIGDWEWVIG